MPWRAGWPTPSAWRDVANLRTDAVSLCESGEGLGRGVLVGNIQDLQQGVKTPRGFKPGDHSL